MGRCNLSLGTYARKSYQWSLQNVSYEEFRHLFAGFTHFFDEVRRKDLPSLRNEIYSYFRGRSNFYRYGNAERGYLYTQSMADDVKALFVEYGYNEPKYERTFKSIVFYE